MRRWILPLLMILVLLPLPTVADAAWNQWGGDPGRSRVAQLPEAPLDVLATFQLLEAGSIPPVSAGLVDTPYGLTGLAVTPATDQGGLQATSQCNLFRLTDPVAGVRETLATLPCENGGKMLGYDPVRDLLFLSIEEVLPDEMLRVMDAANGTQVWSTGPTLDVPATPGAQDEGEWWLNDLIIMGEEGLIYAGFSSKQGRHSIEAIDLATRTSLWQAHLPVQTAFQETLDRLPDAPPERDPAHFPTSEMLTLTRTTTGIVAIGEGPESIGGSVVAWFGLDGERIGVWDTQTMGEPGERAERTFGQGAWQASANANRAVATVGEQLVYIDPVSPNPGRVDLPRQGESGNIEWPSPLWVGDRVFVPTRHEAFIHDPDRGEFSHWPGFQRAAIHGMIGSPGGEVLAMADIYGGTGAPDVLVVIDLEQARTVHAIPVADLGDGRDLLRLTPLSDPPGVLAWHPLTGRAAFLGEADAALQPGISLNTTYPAIGEPLDLQALAPGAEAVFVGWGDGRRARIEPGQTTSNTFHEPGLRTLRVTAVFEDGTTATSEQTLHVGGTPSQDLNLLQQAFARENQDLTFGVLGIVVALAGGLIAVGRRRRQRGILQRELDAIEQAYSMTREDPRACTETVNERRVHCRGLLLDGKIDEGQYAILEKRIEELSGKVRLGILDERFDYLPLGMVRRLEQMLSDGQVSAWEREHFEQVLSQDMFLTEDQKGEVRELVEAWFGQDAGVEGA